MVKRFRNIFALLGVALLAVGLLAACSTDTSGLEQQIAGLQTQVGQLEEQLQSVQGQAPEAVAQPTIMVNPSFYKYPEGNKPAGDLWFYGSGLEPGQWYELSISADGALLSIDLLADDVLRQANDDGAFAVTLAAIRPDRSHPLNLESGQRGGVFVVSLWDADTDALLASTPFVVCGSDLENSWCDSAFESAVVPVPVVEGAGTVWNMGRIRIMDDWFQLRVGSEAKWGYEADSRLDSRDGDGLVITIALGDTIAMERLEDRGTTDHNFTIVGLGIDVAMVPDQRIEPYEFTPDKAGEFEIDCSLHPGAHSNIRLIVTE